MAPDNSAPKSNNGDDNNANSTSAAATATAPSKLLVPRPPLNPYRKIAIVRDPATDVVICEDVERPGKFKKVIVGELMDPSKEKKNVNDEQKVVESGTDRSTNKESEVKTNDEKNEEKKPEASESNNQNRSGSGGKGKPKTEIPVPTITVVKSYWTDVPPTYRVPSSYVRHVPPTYKEVMEESVEYNVDGEDELWWRNNKDFGPESEVTIIWKAVDADNTAVFGVRSTKAKSAVSHDTEISDTNNDAEAEEENSGSEKGDERKGSSSKSNNININVNISSSNNNNDANKTYNKSSNYPKLTRMPKIPKNPTLQQTLLLNPYYLRSVQSTHSLLQKYRPRLPLHIMEQMIEVLEKATCFETIVTEEEAKGILIQKIPQLVDIFGEVDNNNVELDGEERIHSGNEGISVEGESDFTSNSSGSGGGGLGANATADSSIISNINTNKKLTSKNFKQQDRNSGRFISRKNSTTGTKSNIYSSNTINNVNAKQDSTTKPKKVEWKELPNSTSNEKGAEPKSSKKRRRKDRDKKEPSIADVGKAVADASKPAADSSVNENENDTNAHHRESPIVPSLEDNESPPPSDPSTEETNQMQKDKPQTLLPFIAPPITLSNVIHQIYTYWVNKRSKLRKPLLRRYWPVTSTNDVNPHMVFRPRDKVKRKLRKKRQNDYEAYKKMVQLKVDFERLRVLTDLVLKRERVFETMVELSNEYFEERLYQWLDTSGMPRQSGFLNTQKIESAIMDIPKYFDDGPILSGRAKGGKKRKRTSAAGAAPNTAVSAAAAGGLGATMEHERRDSTPNHPLAATDGVSSVAAHLLGSPAPHSNQPAAAKASPQPRNVLVAGFDGGYPAPSFLHPLSTRESHYVTSWENAVPFIPCYQDGMAIPTDRFRHRPRLGRGGRIIIDRFPCPSSSRPDRDDPPPPKVITYGSGMKRFGYHTGILGADGPDYNPNSTRSERSGHHDDSPDNYKNNAATAPRAPPAYQLQDLMPKSLGDPKILSRRIEEICAMGIMEDYQAARADSNINAGVVEAILEEDQGVDEVLVPIEDWMEAPEGEIYGKERFVIGPL
mmetsp:Transcript_11299/g.23817  ORF Transcript_11299/g.23817 Transcript_11299/m.23817 type:complete len:1062 (+) Transcript_11299:52-3237(+)